MGWLFFVNPWAYLALKGAAAYRHQKYLGTSDDYLMRRVYPI